MALNQILLVLLAIKLSYSTKLPPALTACSRSQPGINDCFVKNANLAINYIVNGDPKYQIPNMHPLIFKDLIEIKAPTSPPFALNLTKIIVDGLENMSIVNANLDLDNKLIEFKFHNPKITWKNAYDAKVHYPELTRNVSGKAQIDFIDGYYLIKMVYELNERYGEEYADITDYSAVFDPVTFNFEFENIELDETLNKLWEKAQEFFISDSITIPSCEVVVKVFQGIFDIVPFNNIFTK